MMQQSRIIVGRTVLRHGIAALGPSLTNNAWMGGTTTTTSMQQHVMAARAFASSSANGHRKKKKKSGDCPFKVLGVSSDSDYASVKKAFLHIAMNHHPDTAQARTKEEEDQMRDVFISARLAFEALVETSEGGVMLREEAEDYLNGGDIYSWFKMETGHEMPFQVDLDPQTMKEVAQMTEETGGVGLDRDGGMWTLAKMVARSVKEGGDAASMLRLEAGDVKDRREINGVLRRRRKF